MGAAAPTLDVDSQRVPTPRSPPVVGVRVIATTWSHRGIRCAERSPHDAAIGSVQSMRTGRIHYAWVVAGVTFLALLASAGFRSTVGLFIVPFEADFGWTRDQVSLAISINLVCYGLMAPFSAAIVNRFGARRMMMISLAVVAVGAGLTTTMTALWHLDVLWGVAIGSATGAISIPLSAIVATRWFTRRRGLVTGLLAASFATGNLIFLPLLAWITTEHGWRSAVWIVTICAAAMIPLVAALMRDHPSDIGVGPYGGEQVPSVPVPAGNPFRTPFVVLGRAVRVPDFWLLAGTFFICGWTTNGAVQTHFVPAAHDHGISEVSAAGVLAIIGIFDILGSTASGWFTDRVDPRRLLFIYYSLRGVSLASLPLFFETGHAALIAFAVIYGLDWVATVPPTVMLTNRAFGADAGVVFGWIFCSHMIGGAAAAWLAGYMRVVYDDYFIAFVGGGLLAVVAAFASLAIARGPRLSTT
jgi:predicted MFS family arabinose efflux permease